MITKTGNNGLNPLIRTTDLEKINTQFNEIYNRHFLIIECHTLRWMKMVTY